RRHERGCQEDDFRRPVGEVPDATMPKGLLVYGCLVISPSDVCDARDAQEKAIHDWNAQVGPGLDARVDPVRWESHSRPEMGAAPQDVLNRQMVDKADFGVALFWTKLGTPTKGHESGSVEEIERLLQRGARVMVYFCTAPVPQSALKTEKDREQYARLQKLRERYQQEGLLSTYGNLDELRRVFPLHLTGLVNELLF